ncbi:MAG: dihydrodipicolinate synthase family protein [Alphaproteobacteria bacterium]|nr:dihydrodipicolinate synthase family protein [Alphaproteobacteria bacterium]
MRPFQGLSTFAVTRADEQGRVDTGHLQRLVARLASAEIASIGVLGSTGGYVYLGPAERARAVRAAVEAAGTVPVVAGIGALRSFDMLACARDAEAAGAAGLLLAPVSYLPLTAAEVYGLVRDVSETTGLPICLYNNPGTTHFTITEELLVELAGIGRVQAVKNPAPPDGAYGDQIARLRPRLPEDFSLGYSGDATIAGALAAGADAWYSVLAGTFPDICVRLWRARHDPAQLRALDDALAPIWQCFVRYGGIRVVYEASGMLDADPAELPRPLLPLPADARKTVAAALRATGLIESEAV